ncbi:hypothetical protein ACFWMG_19020 [Streptomyces sp. NPDC127074]|uniref:hypothetical protein n=1 Tax=Streptomyces sp. NPDC127074 TaxID=3347130 RepID=UPI003663D79D
MPVRELGGLHGKECDCEEGAVLIHTMRIPGSTEDVTLWEDTFACTHGCNEYIEKVTLPEAPWGYGNRPLIAGAFGTSASASSRASSTARRSCCPASGSGRRIPSAGKLDQLDAFGLGRTMPNAWAVSRQRAVLIDRPAL